MLNSSGVLLPPIFTRSPLNKIEQSKRIKFDLQIAREIARNKNSEEEIEELIESQREIESSPVRSLNPIISSRSNEQEVVQSVPSGINVNINSNGNTNNINTNTMSNEQSESEILEIGESGISDLIIIDNNYIRTEEGEGKETYMTTDHDCNKRGVGAMKSPNTHSQVERAPLAKEKIVIGDLYKEESEVKHIDFLIEHQYSSIPPPLQDDMDHLNKEAFNPPVHPPLANPPVLNPPVVSPPVEPPPPTRNTNTNTQVLDSIPHQPLLQKTLSNVYIYYIYIG